MRNGGTPTGTLERTDANDKRADGEAGDSVLDQVRGAGTQQGRRRPHALVVVGRLERLAAPVSFTRMRQTARADSLRHCDGSLCGRFFAGKHPKSRHALH